MGGYYNASVAFNNMLSCMDDDGIIFRAWVNQNLRLVNKIVHNLTFDLYNTDVLFTNKRATERELNSTLSFLVLTGG